MFFEQMHSVWQLWLAHTRELLLEIEAKVLSEDILPPSHLVMRALSTDPSQIRVVILGQDPYPNPGDAIGLAFAVGLGRPRPRSLKNIFIELGQDQALEVTESSTLEAWEGKGVLLLNTTLTTTAHSPQAHAKLGWQSFTKEVLVALASRQKVVCLAWGNSARELANSIEGLVVIESAHPSPLSANKGFLGSKPFSRANQALESLGLEPIDWNPEMREN
ncbi:MAG: uracil-DNA glycosylase [Microbacteriaceae bacterium]|nr:uracil-DNA glycosylase [Microbacteriaceae bacterium]